MCDIQIKFLYFKSIHLKLLITGSLYIRFFKQLIDYIPSFGKVHVILEGILLVFGPRFENTPSNENTNVLIPHTWKEHFSTVL